MFSWAGIFLPNAWLLLTCAGWLRFKPLKELRLAYESYPLFTKSLAGFLSFSLIFQLLFVPITLHVSTHLEISKLAYLSLIVPFSEELFFRGFLFHALLRDVKNVHVCAWSVTSLFAFLHLSQGLYAACIMLLLSATLCYLTYITKGIISAILVHVCFNALYYNKLLPLDLNRCIFSVIVITVICLIAWTAAGAKQSRLAVP